MAAVTATPGLSALLAWPTDHLTEAANHWESVGDRSYGVAHGVWSDALTVDWDGEAADALRTDTHADLMTTSGAVDQLQAAATAARSGASELDAARSQVRYAVEDARSAGFEVGEDLSVTDRMTGGSAAQRVARQAAAEAHAGKYWRARGPAGRRRCPGREQSYRRGGRRRLHFPAGAVRPTAKSTPSTTARSSKIRRCRSSPRT